MKPTKRGIPNIVSEEEWWAASEAFREKEKLATKERDLLNAERRRLPMMEITKEYTFKNTKGLVSLLDLFEGRRQLIVYHFMYHKKDDSFCSGCSLVIDQIGHLAHLYARNTSFTLISKAPIDSIERHKKRMSWDMPWYSSWESDFNTDFGLTTEDGEVFGLSVFFQDDGKVYRTYFTHQRGIETLGNLWTLLDTTPWGRQESWEDSPEGVPQTPSYQWWRFHDEYNKN